MKSFILILLICQLSFSGAYPINMFSKSDVICHTGYCLQYSEEHEQAFWVSYEITSTEIANQIYKRKNNFREDPSILSGSASLSDYKGSGYDRGHLMPCGITLHSEKEMTESFYMSNMSPQKPSFNRGIWKKLETKVRKLAIKEDTLYVVTGPLLRTELNKTKLYGVSIPKYYYKVILDLTGKKKAVGFILKNEKSNKPLTDFMYPIDVIEVVTGLDFFSELPDSLENKLESQIDISLW